MADTTLYQWQCSCGVRSRKRLSRAVALKERLRHVARANARDLEAGRLTRPHDVVVTECPPDVHEPKHAPGSTYVPKYFKRYVSPNRIVCPLCKRLVRVTDRGTLWRHKVNAELLNYCPGGGPRAPHRSHPKKGPRPDLAIDRNEVARYLLEKLGIDAAPKGRARKRASK